MVLAQSHPDWQLSSAQIDAHELKPLLVNYTYSICCEIYTFRLISKGK